MGGVGVLVLVLLLLVVGSAGWDSTEYILMDWDEERMWDDGYYLTSIGPRVGGSPEEKQSVDYAYDELLKAGYRPEWLHQYEFLDTSVNVRSARLSFINRMTQEEVRYEHYSDFTVNPWMPPLSGGFYPLVDLGDGSESAFASNDVAGKAVIVTNENAKTGWLYQRAGNHSAAVVIIHNVVVHPLKGYPPFGAQYMPDELQELEDYIAQAEYVPSAYAVSKAAGEEMKDRLAATNPLLRDRTAGIDAGSDIQKGTFPIHVLVAELPGECEDYIMLGGHIDTVYSGPGAIDNTAGAVTTLEAARLMLEYQPDLKRTLKFAFWGGEEVGLKGSKGYYVHNRDDVDEHMISYLNWDMNNANLAVDNRMAIFVPDEEMYNEFLAIGRQMNDTDPTLETRYNLSIKHQDWIYGGTDWHFFYHGSEELNLTGGKPWADERGSGAIGGHSPEDTWDLAYPETMSWSGQFFTAYALEHVL